MVSATRRSRAILIGSALFHGLSLLTHAGAVVAAFVLLPHGFPFLHPRFYANSLLPGVVLAASLVTLVQLRIRPHSATAWLAAYPAAWLGVALCTGLTFPVSGGVALSFAGALATFLGLAWLVWFNCFRPSSKSPSICAALVGLALGLAWPRTQRAPAATTRPTPAAETLPIPAIDRVDSEAAFVRLTPSVRVELAQGVIEAEFGALHVSVRPFLEFQSRSPDRFWTLFTPQTPERRTLRRAARSEALLELKYQPTRSLRVEALPSGGMQSDATTLVASEVYSHLSSFTTVTLSGHRRLGLRFSACPSLSVEVTHADYPVGAPASFAYLDDHDVFRVVRATSAEKGPYTTLASGRLTRGAPLSVSLLELTETPARVLAELRFDDWTSELSTALSPTAGFGVAENAIEFGLASSEPSSTAYLILNLAGTSVGRGWDSVGHRAGIYRNRIRLAPLRTTP